MNAQSESKQVTMEHLHIARSRFLDGFADAEQAIIALHQRLGLKDGKISIGQRLGALGKVAASPTFSKAKVQELGENVERLVTLNELRTDVVHSHMSVARIAGHTRACFINSRESEAEFQTARLVTHEQFVKCAKELGEIALAISRI